MADLSLEGKSILVVGASAGIGLATAQHLAADGARVALAARRKDVLDEVVGELDGAIAIECDASVDGACDAAVAATVEAFGGLDAAIYVVGVSPLGLLDEVGMEQWQHVFATNVFGAGALARAAAPHVRRSDLGRLVFVSSNAPERPWPGMVIYGASKAALDSFIEGWRNEHPDIGATRITVGPTATTMALGWDPELGQRLRARWAEGGYLQPNPQVQMPDDVAVAIGNVLRSATRITDVRVVPPGV